MEKNCEYCKNIFTVERADARYCSPSCRQMAYMERKINSKANLNAIEGVVNNETYPLIDASRENKETPIDTMPENVNTSNIADKIKSQEKAEEKEYKNKQSRFLNSITELTDRDNMSVLNYCICNKDYTAPAYWVSVRLKCLIECVLLLSETKTTDLNDLKEICNAFMMVIQSRHFKSLPSRYPYIKTILGLKEKLKQICITQEQDDEIRFRLNDKNKIEFIATHYELAQFVPKKTFSQLNFKE